MTGSVTLAGMLDVSLFNSFTPSSGNTFTIINNDLADAVSGTFDGIAEGDVVTDGQYSYSVSYVGGDGIDVVLTANALTAITNSGGNLNINDADGNNDTLLVTTSGSNFVITETSGKLLSTGIATATGNGTSTITVPFAELTGTSLNFDLGDGDDDLTIGGTFAPENGTGATSEQFLLIADGQGGTDSVTWAGASTLNVINVIAESITQTGNATTTANQTWDGPVTLGANVTTTASTLNYESTIDGAFDLNVSANGAVFKDSVGSTTPLTKFIQGGIATFEGESIDSTGDIRWNGNLFLDSPTDLVTMTGGTVVSFGTASSNYLRSVTDGQDALVVNTPGSTFFHAHVGLNSQRLRALTTDAAGSTFTSFQLRTTEDVTFNDTVVNRLQTVAVRDLTFAGDVTGFGPITTGITATGDITFTGDVGLTTPPIGFNIAGSTSVTISGAMNVGANGFAVDTSGAITIDGTLTTTAAAVTLVADQGNRYQRSYHQRRW